MEIKVEKMSPDMLEERRIKFWPVWEKGESVFEWYYDEIEECYFLDGEVEIETADGEKVKIEKGDFVIFPKGLSCKWDILKPVKKHYNFKS